MRLLQQIEDEDYEVILSRECWVEMTSKMNPVSRFMVTGTFHAFVLFDPEGRKITFKHEVIEYVP